MYDYVIIGAGIVGLSVGMHLSEDEPLAKIAIVEKEDDISLHQTGHNSGVIHSGIYYKPGSFKAEFARNGSQSMVRFCQENDIPYETCGKLIVAVEEKEFPVMEDLYKRGIENQLAIRKVSKEEINEIEPHVRAISGIFVPSTGIVNYKQVAKVYAEKITNQNGEILTNTKVTDINVTKDFIELETSKGHLKTKFLINCAGLYSDKITKMSGLNADIKIVPFRGEYYQLKEDKQYLVKNLIYPVPNPEFPFLGVHFTRMIDGHIHIGPNAVLSLKREGYKKTDIHLKEMFETLTYKGFWKIASSYMGEGMKEMVKSFSKKAFLKDVQKYFPQMTADDLVSSPAGVRAQALTRDGKLLDDFYIVQTSQSIQIGNAPSPAATASLEIGRYVADMVKKAKDKKPTDSAVNE